MCHVRRGGTFPLILIMIMILLANLQKPLIMLISQCMQLVRFNKTKGKKIKL